MRKSKKIFKNFLCGSDFTIGAVLLKRGMGNFFKGKIGGLAVYNRALSDAEIAAIAAEYPLM